MSEWRTPLERDVATWYANLTEEELRDEQELEKAICSVPPPNVDEEE